MIERSAARPDCLLKNAVLAFFNLTKLRTEFFAARKSTTYVADWHHIPVMQQPAEKINRLLRLIGSKTAHVCGMRGFFFVCFVVPLRPFPVRSWFPPVLSGF